MLKSNNSCMDSFIMNRPWGKFEQFSANEPVAVKIITVNPHSTLSLQYHNKRDEYWRVISGKGFFVLGEEEVEGKKGSTFFVKRGTKHRVRTEYDSLVLLELGFGESDEDDIVRLEDDYGREGTNA